MPIIDIKGVGKAKFPDEMPINDIRAFLRNKYSQQAIAGSSDALQPVTNTATPYNPTLTQKIGQGISDTLVDSGVISNRYGAQEVGRNLSAIGEFLPVIGDATAGDEFGRAVAKGDGFGMALGALGVVPVAGDAAKKAVKAFDMSNAKRMARANEQGFNVDNTLYHGTLGDFDSFSAAKAGLNSRSNAPAGVVFMSSNPEVASSYATGSVKKGQARNVLPLLIKEGKNAEIVSTPTSTWSQMQLEPGLDIDVRDDFLNKNGWRWEDGENRNYPEITDTNEMSIMLKRSGYDAAIFKNISDGKTAKANKIRQDTVAVFKPENIRSKFARFDPENKGKSVLLGGLGALGLGVGFNQDNKEDGF